MQSSHYDLLERIFHKNGWIGCIFIAMRVTILSIWTLLVAVSVGFAQSEKPGCPTINLMGPAGITLPGDPMKFTIELKGVGPQDVQFNWSVSSGKIVDGQGTSSITMINDQKTSVTATVEITGLAEGCPYMASENAPYCEPSVPILVAEGSSQTNRIDKARLNKLVAELMDSPGHQGYMIEYFPPKTPRATINAKTRLIVQHLKKSIDLSRITIVIDTDSSAKPMTRYYIVPPGAMNPTP